MPSPFTLFRRLSNPATAKAGPDDNHGERENAAIDPAERDEPPAGAGNRDRMELEFPEQYHRRKRNLLVATSIAILIGVARDPTTKILGLTDSGMPPAIAISLVWLACLFLMIEFTDEWGMSFVRNSQLTGAADERSIDAIIKKRITLELRTIQDLDALNRDLNGGLIPRDAALNAIAARQVPQLSIALREVGRPLGRLSGYLETVRDQGFEAVDNRLIEALHETCAAVHQVEGAMKNYDSDLAQAGEAIDEYLKLVTRRTEELTDRLRQAEVRDNSILRGFSKLNSNVHRIQRRGIYTDILVAIVLFVVATLLAADLVSNWGFSADCSFGRLCGPL